MEIERLQNLQNRAGSPAAFWNDRYRGQKRIGPWRADRTVVPGRVVGAGSLHIDAGRRESSKRGFPDTWRGTVIVDLGHAGRRSEPRHKGVDHVSNGNNHTRLRSGDGCATVQRKSRG